MIGRGAKLSLGPAVDLPLNGNDIVLNGLEVGFQLRDPIRFLDPDRLQYLQGARNVDARAFKKCFHFADHEMIRVNLAFPILQFANELMVSVLDIDDGRANLIDGAGYIVRIALRCCSLRFVANCSAKFYKLFDG